MQVSLRCSGAVCHGNRSYALSRGGCVGWSWETLVGFVVQGAVGCGVAVCRSTAKKGDSSCCGGGVKVTSCFFQSCGKLFFWKKRKGLVEAGSQQKCF